MNDIENLFDINRVLQNIFLSVEQTIKARKIELIYSMGTSIPRKLRGDDVALQRLLTSMLNFVFKYTTEKETLLCLTAPDDFVYEEFITFKIQNTNISKEKISAFLETELSNNLLQLEGNIIHDEDSDIHIEVPFTIGKLGFRRHYRLPSKSMLEKKVLLIIESPNVTTSIMKMFKYFPYDVDIGFKEFQSNRTNLEYYDVVIIEDKLVTESFATMVKKIQADTKLKYVLLGEEKNVRFVNPPKLLTQLDRPVTQESIFELIVSLFSEGITIEKSEDRRKESRPTLVNCSNMPIKSPLKANDKNDAIHSMIEKKKEEATIILDTRQGIENAKKLGLTYSKELEIFLDMFDKSDLYFRQVVTEKSTNKIKEFCIDLEKQSKIIGAECMLKFSETVNLIFVYNKLDILPIYPGRYHIELRKLMSEIKKYLHV